MPLQTRAGDGNLANSGSGDGNEEESLSSSSELTLRLPFQLHAIKSL
jgi:hypothetical protein